MAKGPWIRLPYAISHKPSAMSLVDLPWSKPQLVQLVVQRLEADAEDFRRARLVVARVLERHQDEPALGLLDRRARRERDLRLGRCRRLLGDAGRQMLRFDERSGREDG